MNRKNGKNISKTSNSNLNKVRIYKYKKWTI